MTILGYDIDGEPLRAGDRVVAVAFRSTTQHNGKEYTITKLTVDPRHLLKGVDVMAIREDGKLVATLCERLRKLPPKQADNEVTTWESIEQLTGWAPEGSCV